LALRPLVKGSPRPATRQTDVGKRFEADCGRVRGEVVERERVDVALGRVAGREDGAVVAERELRESAIELRGANNGPSRRVLPLLGFPRRERLLHLGLLGLRTLALNNILLAIGDPGGFLLLLRGEIDWHFRLVRVVEEREQAEVFVVRDRIELVRVASGAADREAEPDGAGRVRAIDDRVVAEFERVDAAFLVEHRVPVEAGRDALAQAS